MARLLALLPLFVDGMKCGDVKAHYKESKCCGNTEGEAEHLMETSACPYSFDKPHCMDAGVQAPRNVSMNSPGGRPGRFEPLTLQQASKLMQTNIHFHLGAEHYSAGEYDHHPEDTHKESDGHGPKPGYFCDTKEHDVSPGFEFKHCEGLEVGSTYEIHWVHSSAGALGDSPFLTDGLGQAANGRGMLNPMVAVQAQVVYIVNEEEYHQEGMVYGGQMPVGSPFVRYAGSTTGESHTNEICSPYAVTWIVDPKCHPISAQTMDNMCKDMKEMYGMKADLHPHGSRDLVDPMYVVPLDEVMFMTMPEM